MPHQKWGLIHLGNARFHSAHAGWDVTMFWCTRTGKLVENLEAHKQNGYETLTDYIACQIDQDEAEKVTAKEKLVSRVFSA